MVEKGFVVDIKIKEGKDGHYMKVDSVHSMPVNDAIALLMDKYMSGSKGFMVVARDLDRTADFIGSRVVKRRGFGHDKETE